MEVVCRDTQNPAVSSKDDPSRSLIIKPQRPAALAIALGGHGEACQIRQVAPTHRVTHAPVALTLLRFLRRRPRSNCSTTPIAPVAVDLGQANSRLALPGALFIRQLSQACKQR